MSRNLPVPLGAQASRRSERPQPPDVLVLDPARPSATERRASALARLAVNLTPDVLSALERGLTRRRADIAPAQIAPRDDLREYTTTVQFSELEINSWSPLPRRVTLRTATQWTSSTPVAPGPESIAEPAGRPPRLGRAGLGALGLGGAVALAALGLLVNRGGRPRRH